MAVQVKFPDGRRQWIKGRLLLYPNYRVTRKDGGAYYENGFSVQDLDKHTDFTSDCAVISICTHDNDFNWDKR